MKKMLSLTNSRSNLLATAGSLLFGGICLVLSSPKWIWPVFAWLAPAGLLYFTRVTRIRRKWLWLFLLISVARLIANYEVFPMPFVVAIIIVLIGSAKQWLVFIIDRRLCQRTDHFLATLFFPAAMVSLEYLDGFGGGGVWGSLANTQFRFAWLAQFASVTGIWGISFLMYWAGSVVIWVIGRRTKRLPWKPGTYIYTAVFALVLLYGMVRRLDHKPVNTIKVAGVTVPTFYFLEQLYADYSGQEIRIDPRVSQASPALQRINEALIHFVETPEPGQFPKSFLALHEMQDSLFRLSQRAANEGADLITWSEGNGFVLRQQEPALLERGKVFAKTNKVYLLMAIASVETGKITPGKKFVENKAVLIGPEGEVLHVLHKNKPVPMVENSEPGDQVVPVISIPNGLISTSICYDADFPGLMRQLGKKHSGLLVLPSGDWYAISPFHSYMAAFRGIENGCSVFRQVSGGLSMASDSRGRIIGTMDFYKPGEKYWMAQVPVHHEMTLYQVIGDSFAILCLVITAIGMGNVVAAWWIEKRKRRS